MKNRFALLFTLFICHLGLAQDNGITPMSVWMENSAVYDSLMRNADEKSGIVFKQEIEHKGEKVLSEWTYLDLKNGSYMLSVYYTYKMSSYKEQYLVLNGFLHQTYIIETEYFDRLNGEELISWSHDCLFVQGAAISETTNGHGRSETDYWDGEVEATERFNERLKLLTE